VGFLKKNPEKIAACFAREWARLGPSQSTPNNEELPQYGQKKKIGRFIFS
jgi:hypothetical protein